MAPDRKLSASGARPGDFSIPAAGTERPVTVKLRGTNHTKYDVWKKDIPADIPTSWTDPDDNKVKSIVWLNNFGLKMKGQAAYQDDVDEYDVELEEVPDKELVYYSKNQVIKFKNVQGVGTGKLTVSLAVGDPPLGGTTR